MIRYNPREIEPKWQKIWHDTHAFRAEDFSDKPKTYVSCMFPYPSGAGMHTGHIFEHSIVDAIARFYRANGHNVINPMGWDSFGLPAENYAIKTGTPPSQTTKTNIANFKNQLERVGASIDWDREINTSDPEYYKWTQWIFTQLLERGLAYQKESLQWWCPVDKTVLANEQVEGGHCWRCGSIVEKKSMKQWFFKITDYADELLDEIPSLDWPEKIKTAQTNWIGRSQGAEIDFEVVSSDVTPNFVILHGYTGRADKNFIPKLKSDLEAKGYKVQAPQLPNTDNPSESEQVTHALEHCTYDENTVIIGHSLGGAVAMKVIEKLDHPVRELILVAPVVDAAHRPADYVRPFFDTFDFTYDYDLIISRTSRRVVLSDTQEKENRMPYLEYLAPKIKAELVTVTARETHFTADEEPDVIDALTRSIKVFTTRPDTIFGATFIVVAPDHPMAASLLVGEQKQLAEDYIREAVKKSEIDRMNDTKEKTGVFTGSYAVNPASGEKIPVWVADYVLAGYGTGAIMAVPAHDERDYLFAKKFDLPITQVVASHDIFTGDQAPRDNVETRERTTVDAIIKDNDGNYLIQIEGPQKHFVGGGVDDGESLEDALLREIKEETGYVDIASIRQVAPISTGVAYRHTKDINQKGVGYYYEVTLASLEQIHSEADDGKHELAWVTKEKVRDSIDWSWQVDAWDIYVNELPHDFYQGEGVLVNSAEFDGVATSDARETIVNWLEQQGLGKSKVTYKMRDWLISRQRYWGAPIPVIHCDEHGAVPVPKDQLPVILPVVEDYEPKGDGKSVLAREEEWVNVPCPVCGQPAKRETDTMDGYACSSWYLLRYTDPHNNEQAWRPDLANYWTPVDFYVGGDHAVAHLLYVRFWNHVFKDMGLLNAAEPVKKLVYHGYINAEDGTKMSKSKGNVIDPLEVIDQGYGADALRTYLLFMGPIELDAAWSSKGIAGVYRFLNRAWTLVQEYHESEKTFTGNDATVQRAQHKMVRKVTDDYRRLSFNTAISAMMEYVNELYKLKVDGFSDVVWKDALEALTQCLAPLAPHMAEELWTGFGHDQLIQDTAWPQWDDALIVDETITIVVQVNGKLRAKLEIGKDASKEEIESRALAEDNVKAFTEGREPAKIIYVPHKLVNIVVK